MAHKKQPVLFIQFQLHRFLPFGRLSAFHRGKTLCTAVCAARSRALHARVSGAFVAGEHADRRLLVLSVFRRVRGGHDSLRRRKNLRPAAFRTRLVRLCLLDSHGFRPPPVQSAAKAPQRKAGHAALCDVRALVRARLRSVPDEILEPRAHHVLAVPHRQHSLLCRRHRARVYF